MGLRRSVYRSDDRIPVGPGLSGKTTNLQMIHQRTLPDVRGRLLTVETHDDRTLFFDLLPVFFTPPPASR